MWRGGKCEIVPYHLLHDLWSATMDLRFAAFAHDAVLRKRAISSLVSAATVVIHLSRAVSRSGSEIFSTSSSISTQRLSRKPSSDALVAKMPSIR